MAVSYERGTPVYALGFRVIGLGSRDYHFFYRARGTRAHEENHIFLRVALDTLPSVQGVNGLVRYLAGFPALDALCPGFRNHVFLRVALDTLPGVEDFRIQIREERWRRMWRATPRRYWDLLSRSAVGSRFTVI